MPVVEAIRGDDGVAEVFAADITDERAGRASSSRRSRTGSGPWTCSWSMPRVRSRTHRSRTVAWDDHVAQLDFFVKSPVLLGRAVLPGMRAKGSGRIIHIDSEVADRPPPGRSAYAAAKSAQIGLARAWARELAPLGITVNAVAPGFVAVERHADVPAQERAAYVASVPMGRMGTREEIAHAVSFFASEGAAFVTGQRLVVDGGRALG